LREVTPDLLLVANDRDAARWLKGVPVTRDLHPGGGGLAGVEAALSTGRDIVVLAWDMPFVTARVLRALIDVAHDTKADAVLPESESPYGFEPFCGFYSQRVRPLLTRFLEEGGGAAKDFVAQLENVERIPLATLSAMGDPRELFLSVNTHDDLERARAMAARKE
jgi:molybdopterin-guanine dinucleotide biosynthesis protein A